MSTIYSRVGTRNTYFDFLAVVLLEKWNVIYGTILCRELIVRVFVYCVIIFHGFDHRDRHYPVAGSKGYILYYFTQGVVIRST
jgi:hypothetical protein